MVKVKKLERIFGSDGMSNRRKKVVLRKIDSEARRVARLFKDYMPADVITLFNQSLSLHVFGQVVERKYRIVKARRRAKRRVSGCTF